MHNLSHRTIQRVHETIKTETPFGMQTSRIRKYNYESSIQEDLLFCKPLPTRTTAAEIFKLINYFIIQSDIDWKKCVGLSSDGARAMAESRTGLVPRIRAVVPDCVWVHCNIHREVLAVKTMPSLLSSTLQECVKFINYIKSRPLNSRIFTALCNKLGSEHEHLLLHYKVRWLSKGNIFKRLFEMKDEVLLFLE
nr:zinc finger BED domain-containing protein 5-like [Pelodiscus sinensis]|eukprot:XP_025038756.1 zinc finger BED domain-containing protein 5-like [Pelodiscus sinensis]